MKLKTDGRMSKRERSKGTRYLKYVGEEREGNKRNKRRKT